MNNDALCVKIYNSAELIYNSLRNSKKLILCGNGGSASDALHFAGEMVGRFQKERKAWPAIVLNADVATLTAISNDYGYDNVFERQAEAYTREGDIFLGISTSGNSKNVYQAMKKAKDLMARDGITLEKTENERIYMVPLYEGKRFPFSVRMLLSYISGLTGVYVVISQDGEKKTAIAYGSVEETETSIYLYDYLMSGAEKEIARLRNQGEHISKDSFLRGAISELTRKTEDTNSDNAIIAIRTENMKKTKRIVYPTVRLSRKMTRAHGGDASSYSKGVGFGSKLSVKAAIDRRELE